MADTIISNIPRTSEDSGSAGWVAALIIVLTIIIGGVVMYQKGLFSAVAPTPSTTNINVTVPNPDTVAPTVAPTTE